MWNKIFFRNTEQAKYAKYTIIFSAFFALFLTTVSVSHAQSTSESEKNTDQNARIILQNSIHALQTSQNYAVDLHCRAQIFGIFFSGKGMYCQKRQRNTFTAKERISSRWEMEYYFPTFHQYNLSVLNGEQMKLWRFNERRTIVGMDAPNTSTHPKSSASDLE
ncbi:MAG: hypothetical protein Q4C70_11240, partial [Planctomycetia bacterium]|nr:hypothetical protein [Planctomycetia bacterium]